MSDGPSRSEKYAVAARLLAACLSAPASVETACSGFDLAEEDLDYRNAMITLCVALAEELGEAI